MITDCHIIVLIVACWIEDKEYYTLKVIGENIMNKSSNPFSLCVCVCVYASPLPPPHTYTHRITHTMCIGAWCPLMRNCEKQNEIKTWAINKTKTKRSTHTRFDKRINGWKWYHFVLDSHSEPHTISIFGTILTDFIVWLHKLWQMINRMWEQVFRLVLNTRIFQVGVPEFYSWIWFLTPVSHGWDSEG